MVYDGLGQTDCGRGCGIMYGRGIVSCVDRLVRVWMMVVLVWDGEWMRRWDVMTMLSIWSVVYNMYYIPLRMIVFALISRYKM